MLSYLTASGCVPFVLRDSQVFIILVLSWVPKEVNQQRIIRWVLSDLEASVFALWYRE